MDRIHLWLKTFHFLYHNAEEFIHTVPPGVGRTGPVNLNTQLEEVEI